MPLWWWIASGFFGIVVWGCAVLAVWIGVALFFRCWEDREARRIDREFCKRAKVRL